MHEKPSAHCWPTEPVKSLFYIKGRLGWKGLKASEFLDEGPFLITGTDFEGGRINWSRSYRVSERRYIESPEIMVQPADVLITKDGTIGKVAFVDPIPCPGRASLNSHLFLVRGRTGRTSQRFAFYVFSSEIFRHYINTKQSGSTLSGLSQRVFEKFSFPLPGLSNQERIAEILSTIDEAIEQTEALIAKTQQIKAGLMLDLFTRGVTADGRLRPPREEAPQLYKESPLGWIPKDWGCEGIDCIGTWASGGTPAKAQPEFWGGDIPWVTPKDMKVFRLESTQDTLTPTGAGTGSRVVQKDSVFIVVRGMILAHTFPVCLAIAPMAFNQDVKALVPGSLASGEFLAHWFAANKDYMLGLVTEATHGTKRIDMRDIFRSQIGLPPAREQAEIVHILNEVDAKLEVTRSEAFKLQEMKSGLMQDLLSGAVSVAIEHEPKPKEVATSV